MQNDIAHKIQSLASRREPLSESEVSHLMILSRKYLDHMPPEERANYLMLRLFCNWAAHVVIDRSMEGLEVLKRLNDALVEVAPIPDNDTVGCRLTSVLSFRELRRELGVLLENVGVSEPLDRDQTRWTNFVRHLIEIIRDCPIGVGDVENMSRRARELYESIKTNPLQQRGWVVGLAVTEVDYGQFGAAGRNEVCLHILLSDTTHIVVPMTAPDVFGEPSS